MTASQAAELRRGLRSLAAGGSDWAVGDVEAPVGHPKQGSERESLGSLAQGE